MKLMIKETVDFLDNDFLTKSDLPIDIQWKIYRGTLSRKSLALQVYKTFTEQYNEFYELYDIVVSDDSPEMLDLSVISRIEQLGRSLEKMYDDLANQLDRSAKFELKVCLEKIVNFLKDLRKKAQELYYAN